MKLSRVLLLAPLCALVLVAGCSSSSDSKDATGSKDDQATDSTLSIPDSDWVDETGKGTVTIDARDNVFDPKYVSVSPGTKIVFHNRGRNPHNVIAVEKDAFKTVTVDDFKPGDSDGRTFDDTGEFQYYCSLHGTPTKGMNGGIRVLDK